MTHEEKFFSYGSLYEQELLNEANYKLLGEQALQASYDKERTDDGDLTRTKLGQKFMSFQYLAVREGVAKFIEALATPRRGVKPTYYLIILDMLEVYRGREDELIDMLALSSFSVLFRRALGNDGKISSLASTIGNDIRDEVQLQAYMNEHKDKEPSVITGMSKRVQPLYRREYVRARMGHDDFSYKEWNRSDMQALGGALIDTIIHSCNYFEYVQGETMEIRGTQQLIEAWRKNEEALVSQAYKLCPTVIPPEDWTGYSKGGYHGELQYTSPFLRLHGQRTPFLNSYMRRLSNLELKNVYKAINAIQATPWCINIQVLDIIKQIVSNGGGQAGIPYMNQPPPPVVLPPEPTEEQIAHYKKHIVPFYRSEARRKSLALRVLSHIRLADEFKSYERIYFPHNMDFRGRVYPIPSFSPQGDDLNKGLLLFTDVPPINDIVAEKWFLVTGANLAGVDKVSYEDRITWVKENHDNILRSANEPLGDLWWADQDCPIQFLAFCFEYKRYVEHIKEHGSILGFVTGLPVAYDGTCSGLQHFSAILRDPVGGKAVNLVPSDKPQDIYAVVAEKVNNQLKIDARTGTDDENTVTENGVEYIKYGTRTLAQQWLAFGVTRKVTKRNVMTLAYGSKEFGFRQQIQEDIIKPDLDEKGIMSIFAESYRQADGYLAKLIWNAVSTTVVKAVEGMKWLQACSKEVTKERQVVTWVTPMGLPVQQNYMENENKTIRLNINGTRLRLYQQHPTGAIDKRKQSSGIAPNFIHSMDASHLQLTTCVSYDRGIRHFAMIHDSYGCPVAQAQILYDTVRETFVSMYESTDVLANFRADLQLLTSRRLPEPPLKGTLDLSVIKDSEYIFS